MENSDQETSTGPQTANQRGAADVSPDTAGSSSGSLSAELWQPPLAEWPSSALWEWAGPVSGELCARHADRPEVAQRLESLTINLFGSGAALGMSDIEELTPGFVERWCERPVGDGGRSGPRAPSGSTVRFNRWAAREILEAAVEAGAQIEPDALVPLRNARRPAANAASLEESAASRQPRNLTDDDWAALACGQRRGMGIAHEASDAASTEAAVNAWSPRWSRKDLREGQVVLGAVRPWVLAANPPSVTVARSWLRIVADHTAFFCSKDGTLDPEHIFNPENINHWVMKVIGGRFPSTQRTVRSTLRRVGRAVAPAVSPRQMKSLGTVEAAVIYSAVEEESFRLAAELEWPSNRAARMWLSVATLGAGLRGVEAQMQGPGDVVAAGAAGV